MPSKYLIIGQGLAGTLLSFFLRKEGIEHDIIDKGHVGSATMAAAGIVNPITGRYFTKSWMFDTLLSALDSCYTELSELLDISILEEKTIYRRLGSPLAENQWSSRLVHEEYKAHDGGMSQINEIEPAFDNEYYAGIKNGRKVNIALLVSTYRKLLKREGCLIESTFDSSDVDFQSDYIRYNDESYQAVIYCNGAAIEHDSLWSSIPMRPAQGQSLQVSLDISPGWIVKNKYFLAGNPDGTYWTGGGYHWKERSTQVSETFIEEQKKWLNQWLGKWPTILDKRAGIRPCTPDRKPILGKHKQYDNIYIFNGLGTKGTSLGPHFARIMANVILKGKPIPEEVDVLRFY